MIEDDYCTVNLDDVGHNKKKLFFDGGGGMYNYYFGIASVIQKQFDLTNIDLIGASAGAITTTLLASKLDFDDVFINVNLPLLNDIRECYTGSLFNFNYYARERLLASLPPDMYTATNLTICVTKLPYFRTVKVNTWQNNEQLMDTIVASGFVPLFDTKLSTTIQGLNGLSFVDGCLSDYTDIVDANTLFITKNMWRPTNLNWFWCYPDQKWANTLYKWGKDDATEHLDELKVFFDTCQNC